MRPSNDQPSPLRLFFYSRKLNRIILDIVSGAFPNDLNSDFKKGWAKQQMKFKTEKSWAMDKILRSNLTLNKLT